MASACAVLILAAGLALPGSAGAEARSWAFINGEAVSVHFSDGDSFRMYGGDYPNDNARLAGFNALESFGPAHQWGEWHPYELFVIAKKATLNAQRGIWHCTTTGERDTYDRVLLDCPDLAVDQIRKGLAHAMQIDDTTAPLAYIRAQRAAIEERRGMWAHGVPDFVLTSLHALREKPGRKTTYNRMISTRDGHTEKWVHGKTYDECEWECATEVRADGDAVRAYAQRLRADRDLASQLEDIPHILLVEIVERYARLGELPGWVKAEVGAALTPYLTAARRSGALGEIRHERGACMIYVTFQRRYGDERDPCLEGHGNWDGGP